MKSDKYRILLVEDDTNLGHVLQDSLELQDFSVTLCKDGEEAHSIFFKKPFDLCLIDVMLPKKDGFTLAEDIRKSNQDIPILFLTARSMKEDRIQGFKIGGDDYITKPFNMEELVLRILAVLKRSRGQDPGKKEQTKFTLSNYIFDYETRTLKLKRGRKKMDLTHKEAELLRLLCLHKNQVLERSNAMRHIWGDDSYFIARSMDVYISKLRKYLKDDPNVKIDTIHGTGFKLIVR
jgi:DNA-binding response OmpR family regulator